MAGGITVSNDILRWAIDRAGFSLDDFASRFPRINDWLSGKKQPTVKQLEDFSRKVHVPFGYLFLPQPPNEAIDFPFFRTGAKHPRNEVSLNVYDTIMDIKRRQEWLTDYLLDLGEGTLSFVGSFTIDDAIEAVVGNIRSHLELEEEWGTACATWEDALDTLVKRIDSLRIIVSFNGIVGNNTHRVIPVEECRGFVLVNDVAPFMFVNGADAKSAQLFTIVHELAHVWIGKSAGFDYTHLMPADDQTERFCDQVAAEFLVPATRLVDAWRGIGDLRKLASKFKVSQIVVARRALDLGLIAKEDFFNIYNAMMTKFLARKQDSESGGNFYYTVRKRVSPSFAAYVDRAVRAEHLTYRDAYRLTGLTGKTYNKLVAEYLT